VDVASVVEDAAVVGTGFVDVVPSVVVVEDAAVVRTVGLVVVASSPDSTP
jgi:hypothetical protein